MPVDPSVASQPIVLYVLLGVGVATIVLGALSKGTTGLGAWLNSLRRIGAEAKAADLMARESEIMNLSHDLKKEREARQKDREYFDSETSKRDKLAREHVKWDWKVYNVLVLAGLLSSDDSQPPPLF